ncbi:type I methionyl aminopeptidase [Pelobacter propionicus]|uniref:Methionine aminopeptidase n=1 Tax=Pelobacter propionicus (strain DSM 2379 / NBRC 103807 / OttBd1) TaxID=338966 RepID=A1ALW3_PELPD|nr:type I methionyl aminopeptidase [Pelobacter propionicus]ABK98333.1 methionine aminopeptidase, type I [Pelobacter propionicus DSM 2379]
MIVLKSLREIERMRVACRLVAEVLEMLKEAVRPGVSTCDLEDIALKHTLKNKAKPAFKGYCNYPSALCCSPNQQVVHGVPNREPLRDGDILSLDFGVLYDDFYGDAAVTLPVGIVSEKVKSLIATTEQSLYRGIEKAIPGNRLTDISHAIQDYVEKRGFSVVRDFVGHGIGRGLHEEPQIPNYGAPAKGVKLKAGMVFAIEPMINEKSHEVKILDDGWTVVTLDGGMSAHFEHTVAITDNGPDILTRLV